MKPSNPTPNHLRHLKVSLLDQLNLPILIPFIFFYSPNNSPSTNEVLDRLKSSLPTTLSMFYPLAGRVQDANFISCNDEGVPYITAKVKGIRLGDVVHKANVPLLDKLVPYGDKDGFFRLMLAIQVTEFACGGVAIGAQFNHAICDAFSDFMFVKSWADIANGTNCLQTPYFELWKIIPPSPKQTINNVPLEPNPDFKHTRAAIKWFLVSKTKLELLRSTLYPNSSSSSNNGGYVDSDRPPSLGMILSAFIWSKIKLGSKGNNSVRFELFHVLNIRPKVSPPTGQSYLFGNMLIKAFARPSTAENNEDTETLCKGFLSATKLSIDEALNNEELMRALQEGREEFSSDIESFERKYKGEIKCLTFSNMRSLPAYESDFGWGKPLWVALAGFGVHDAVFLIPASASSKDICAYIYLSHEEMAMLENDYEFLSLLSKTNNGSS